MVLIMMKRVVGVKAYSRIMIVEFLAIDNVLRLDVETGNESRCHVRHPRDPAYHRIVQYSSLFGSYLGSYCFFN